MSVHTRVVQARRRADSRAATEPRSRPAPQPGEEAVHETLPYERDFSPEVEDRSAAQRDSLPYCEVQIVASPPGNVAVPSLDGPTERDLPPPSELFAESSDVWTLKHPKSQTVETSKVPTIRRDKPERIETSKVPTLERGARIETAKVATLERIRPVRVDTEKDATRECDKRGRIDTSNVTTLEHDRPVGAEGSNVLTIKAERRRLGRGSGPQPKHPDERATVDDKPPQIKAKLSWLGVAVAQPEVGAPLVIGTWLSPEFRVTSPVTRMIKRPDGVLVQTATKSRYFVKPAGDAFLVGGKR